MNQARDLYDRRPGPLQLQAASGSTRVWLALLSFALPVVLAVFLPWIEHRPAASSAWVHDTLRTGPALEQWLGPLPLAALFGVVWLVLDRLLRRHDLRLDDAGIDIRTTLYRRRVAWADLDLDGARVVDVDEHPEMKPFFKSNGYALPGFRSGWFRSRAFARLFVATAGGSRLLWLPTRLGYTLLLQPGSPSALLDRLRQQSPLRLGTGARDARLR